MIAGDFFTWRRKKDGHNKKTMKRMKMHETTPDVPSPGHDTFSSEPDQMLPTNILTLPYAGALEAIRQVRACSAAHTGCEPSKLPQGELTEITQVFQIRDAEVDERHVSDLVKVLVNRGTIEPIKVWRCGQAVIVIDGHHRLEAYRRWNRKKSQKDHVPVSFFEGTVEEAIRFAEKANSDHKLTLTSRERFNYAWRLVSHSDELGKLSKADLVERTNVSKGTIDNMRKAAKELGHKARSFIRWYDAQREWQHGDEERDYDDNWVEVEAMKLVDRLGKTCGNTLAKRPEITARAFGHILGRRTPEVALKMLEEYGFTVTLRDHDGNEVDDVEDFELRKIEEVDVPF